MCILSFMYVKYDCRALLHLIAYTKCKAMWA